MIINVYKLSDEDIVHLIKEKGEGKTMQTLINNIGAGRFVEIRAHFTRAERRKVIRSERIEVLGKSHKTYYLDVKGLKILKQDNTVKNKVKNRVRSGIRTVLKEHTECRSVDIARLSKQSHSKVINELRNMFNEGIVSYIKDEDSKSILWYIVTNNEV